MRIANDDFIQAGTTSDMSISFNSTPVWLGHIVNYSIQLTFTDNPNGILKLQLSNDIGNPSLAPTEQYKGVSHWTDVTGSSQTITESGDHMWEVANSGSRWVRFVWTASSGSGTLTTARFDIKGA